MIYSRDILINDFSLFVEPVSNGVYRWSKSKTDKCIEFTYEEINLYKDDMKTIFFKTDTLEDCENTFLYLIQLSNSLTKKEGVYYENVMKNQSSLIADYYTLIIENKLTIEEFETLCVFTTRLDNLRKLSFNYNVFLKIGDYKECKCF